MNFDLEIQPNNFQLVSIPEGTNIPNAAIPLYFYNLNKNNLVPSDLIDIAEEYSSTGISSLPILTVNNGYSFNTLSDKFMLTHISKYSTFTGTRTPLFYKHLINIDVTDVNSINAIINSIDIFDADNNQINQDLYHVESFPNILYVYVNKITELMIIIMFLYNYI